MMLVCLCVCMFLVGVYVYIHTNIVATRICRGDIAMH